MPAFTLTATDPSTIPVLIAVPHAGRGYTRALLDRMRHPQLAGRRLEDRHVDALGRRIAAATGAALLVAQAPRALIDLNRAVEDIDWAMVRDAPPRAGGDARTPGPRVRAGLGLIPRRIPDLGEIWRGPHDLADVRRRIADVHAPYHAAIAAELARIRERWGAALLIDLHSMPPLPREGGSPPPEFVIGDRFGASADGTLAATAFRHFAAMTRRAAHNRPYAGGHALDRHGRPAERIHALQIEIDRASYLDPQLDAVGEGFGDVATVLAALCHRLGRKTAASGASRIGWSSPGSGWAEAAE